MEDFCGSKFWDTDLTWNTTDPYLTQCFEDTVLVWFPAAFVLIFALVDIFGFNKKETVIPWNLLSVVKCLLCVALVAISTIQNILMHDGETEEDPIHSSDTFAPITRIASYVVALFLLVISKRAGVRSSGVQSLYWFSAAVCEAVLFRTAMEKYDDSTGKIKTVYFYRLFTFPLVFVQLLLYCWADSTLKTTEQNKLFGKPSPEKTSSFFSKLLYTWYDGMAWKGYRKPLTNADLWDLNAHDASNSQVPLFYKYWNAEKAKLKGKDGKREAGILSVLFKAYGPTFFMGGIFKLAMDMIAFVSPEALKLMVGHVSNSSDETWKGYLYAGILFGVALIQALLNVQYNRRMLLIGMRVRTALSNAVYRKALLLSNAVKKDQSVGEIVNLMSVDTQRFMDLMPFIHLIWVAPLQIGLSIYFLYNILGASVFAGLAVMLLLIPINGFIAAKIRELQVKQMKLKDDRVKLMSEILGGIKVLKLYAWEPSFEDQIKAIRVKEIKYLRTSVFLNASTIFAFTCAPFLVSLATFATFVYSDEGNILNAENAFVSLSLFNIMRMPLTMFPMVVALTVQTMVSVDRLNNYLNSPEIDTNAVTHDPKEEDPVIIENGSFSWTEDTVTLSDINLRVKHGSLVAVVGTVGSGKSTLLNAILGDLNKLKGRVNTKGTQAFVAQGAWIQNASLRDNILFGDPFNSTKYNRVIQACALGPDLEILAAGDQTEIGEKGINLSGGQKQRVALARAAYKESDTYYFDDPLSAVDSHVGKHIFESLIGHTGILKGKTRVLVTHGISFLPKTDKIIVMKDGRISETGTYKELLHKKGDFANFLLEHLGAGEDEEIDPTIIQDLEQVVGKDEVRRSSSIDMNRRSIRRQISKEDSEIIKRQSLRKKLSRTLAEEVKGPSKEKLIEAERTETGSIDPKVYIDYIKGSGLKNFTIAMSFNILFQALSSYSNIWLSEWSNKATIEEMEGKGQVYETTDLYLGVYGGLGGAQAIAVLVGTITLGLATLRASAKLHENMLSRVMRAPMWFFDTTPLGRLVNRFAKDVDTADNIIPMNIRATLNIVLSVLATIIVISYGTPLFLAFIVPLAVVYYFLQRFYVATSRQLKRLESVSRSPIYSHFGETLSGATTIRAFALEEDFIEASQQKIDYNQKTYFPFISSNLWVGVRLEAMGGLIILAASLFGIFARAGGTITPGDIGLTISYSLQITSLLGFLVRVMSDLETNIVAIERMKETTGSPQEALWDKDPKPPKEWPEAGKLDFNGYQTRYREGLDLVLRGITCTINAGEKIGIVGRTGAGKSSMTLALFRLVEPAGGSIKIDGVDVTSLGLHDLRSKITIIPQDPVLFCGTLRGNLDPFNLYTDDQVWTCLELAHLKTFVKGLPEGLSHTVAEEGSNYSVGQRQLVCLARALLRKTKILVLDEATAAVDLETDDLIQKTIRSEFMHSTVVTIAHRLNTIMDSTRVLVLDKGEIKEFDTPAELLRNSSSIFYGMAKDAGLV